MKENEDLLDQAWGIIANAFEGDWDKAPLEWKILAERWRNRYLEELEND